MSVTIPKWFGGILRKSAVLVLTVVMGMPDSFAATVLKAILSVNQFSNGCLIAVRLSRFHSGAV